MLQPGGQVPHFEVTTLDGQDMAYRSIWQRQNLVLVTLPQADRAAADYADGVRRRLADLTARDTAVVLTDSPVDGLPAPGVLVADRWGEISFAQSAASAEGLAPPEDLLEWLRFTQFRCPECEGEWR